MQKPGSKNSYKSVLQSVLCQKWWGGGWGTGMSVWVVKQEHSDLEKSMSIVCWT